MNRNHYSQMLANLTNKVGTMVKTTLWPGDDECPLTVEVTAATELLLLATAGLSALKAAMTDNVLHVNRSALLPNIHELNRYKEQLGRCRSPLRGEDGADRTFDSALDAMLATCSHIARYVPGYDHPERASLPMLASLTASKYDTVVKCVRDYYSDYIEPLKPMHQKVALCSLYAVLAKMESPILKPGELPKFDAPAFDKFLLEDCSITYSKVEVAGNRYRQIKILYGGFADELATPSLTGLSDKLKLFIEHQEAFDRLLTSSLHPVASSVPLPDGYRNPECPALPMPLD